MRGMLHSVVLRCEVQLGFKSTRFCEGDDHNTPDLYGLCGTLRVSDLVPSIRCDLSEVTMPVTINPNCQYL